YRCDGARRHADRLALRRAAGQHGHARREAAEQLAELLWLDAWKAHRTSPARTRGVRTARAGMQFPVARTSRSASSGRRIIRPTTRSISAGHPTAMPINRSSNHLPANSRRRARVYCRRLAPVASVSRIADVASSAPRNDGAQSIRADDYSRAIGVPSPESRIPSNHATYGAVIVQHLLDLHTLPNLRAGGFSRGAENRVEAGSRQREAERLEAAYDPRAARCDHLHSGQMRW